MLATIGFLVIPARRRRAKTELQEKVTGLRARLAEALRGEFERAQQRSLERMEGAVAPYTRFVRAEAERWTTARSNLATLREQTAAFLEKLAEPAAAPR